MLRLAKYLRPYVRECILSPAFKLLEALFQLLTPLVVARIIDVGVARADSAYIIRSTVVLVVLAAVGLVCALFAQYFASVAGSGFGTTLRDELFAHILTLPEAEVDQVGTPTLIARMTNDTQQIQDGVNRFFRLVLRSPFIVFGSLVCAFLIDGRQGLIFVATIAVLFTIVAAVMRVSVRGFTHTQALLDRVTSRTSENLAGVRTIRAYRMEVREEEALHAEDAELLVSQRRVGRISAITNPATYAVVNLALIAILSTGAVEVNVGILSQGAVVALTNYISQILLELIKLADLLVLMSRASASAKRVCAIFDLGAASDEASSDARTVPATMSFRDVSFTYPEAASPALEHINFSLDAGATLGVIGGTGSGKTTLAELMVRTYDASVGEVDFGGCDVCSYTLESLHKAVGIVEQRVRLFSGTIASNLAWGAHGASDEELLEAARLAQAGDVIEAHGGTLDAPVAEGGANFSGGQKQRLSIARTLAAKPHLLILDDSTSALDFATEARLRHALAHDLPTTTKVIISQRASAIRHADAILVLDGGRQVGYGTHEELLATCATYQQICASQLAGGEVSSR